MKEPLHKKRDFPMHISKKNSSLAQQLVFKRYLSPTSTTCTAQSLLQFGDFSFCPDFTIRHPQTGNLFSWVHFGMMDNPAYAQSTFQKLSLYNSYGFLSNVNLITTFESKDHPLDVTYVESLVNHFFL